MFFLFLIMRFCKVFFVKCFAIQNMRLLLPPRKGKGTCPGGGIGRRAGLKHQWGNPYRFDPGPGYHHQNNAHSAYLRPMSARFFFTLFCSLNVLLAQGQMYIEITSWPANTPAQDPFYYAGNTNNWQPGSANYVFVHDSVSNVKRLALTNPPSSGNQIEFKITRGSWATVEGTAQGGFRPNRTATWITGDTLRIGVAGWEGSSSGNSTAQPNVSILSNFFMPQLNRNRRIWIYTPPDYGSSGLSYPVIYMHDGQNLFDNATAFAGEWQVDEKLNQMHSIGVEMAIVVGIDNGGADRINEYSPWAGSQGGGQGAQYVDFIVQTLKPYIDQNYRTKPQREFTHIMGSSLGALISLYATLKHPEVFTGAGLFSPAYWYNPQIFNYISQNPAAHPHKFYSIAGLNEGSGDVAQKVYQSHQLLEQAGYDTSYMWINIHTDGQHSEWYWAREFGSAYLHLMFSGLETDENQSKNRLIWNYRQGSGQLELKAAEPITEVLIYDLSGKLVFENKLATPQPTILLEIPLQTQHFYLLQVKFQSGQSAIDTLLRP